MCVVFPNHLPHRFRTITNRAQEPRRRTFVTFFCGEGTAHTWRVQSPRSTVRLTPRGRNVTHPYPHGVQVPPRVHRWFDVRYSLIDVCRPTCHLSCLWLLQPSGSGDSACRAQGWLGQGSVRLGVGCFGVIAGEPKEFACFLLAVYCQLQHDIHAMFAFVL